jgi:DNA-binding NtrC family response regulator
MDGHHETHTRGTILFVDDERRVLTSMRAMFRRDYEVLLANSGPEALALLREHDVDVIVSDQRMPGMTGVEVLKQVKLLAPRAMRILLTGYADLKAIEASINEGEVFRYLTKPCAAEQLREAIELAVEASAVGASADASTDTMSADEMASEESSMPATVEHRTESVTLSLPLEPVAEVAAPAASHSDFFPESDAFELIEVVPKGATATPPRTVRSVQKKEVPAAPTPLHAQPVQRNEPPPAPPLAPTPAQQTRAGPRPAVNLLASAPAPAAPRSPPGAASSAAPATPPAAAPRRPVRTPVLAQTRVPAATEIRDVDLLVLTRDKAMVQLLESVVDKRRRLHAAGDLERAISLLEAHPIGVLVTDLVVREDEIARLTAELKRHVPELVTIVVSERSDAQQLIELINYGQIFRFLLKPLQPGQSRLSIDSAVARHRALVLNPALARRHVVAEQPKTVADGVMQQVMARVRRLRARFSTVNGAV